MLSSRVKGDFQTEPHPRLSLDEREWVGAWCPARPVRTRFPAWRTIGRSALEVDFVGGPAGQGHVRPVLVVPGEGRCHVVAEDVTPKWDERQTVKKLFHCEDGPFNHGDATVLSNSSEAWLNVGALAPRLEPAKLNKLNE